MKENWQAIKDGWCPICEPGKFTPMVEECGQCKSNPITSKSKRPKRLGMSIKEIAEWMKEVKVIYHD